MNTVRHSGERLTAREAALHWRTLQIRVAGGADQLERLLLGTVEPWIGNALAANWVDSWYLTRPPWDPGGQAPAELKLQFRNTDRHRLSDLAVRVETFFTDQPAGRAPGDTVVQRAFTPVIELFGGDHGMAVCVAHHMAASRIAVNIIRNAPSRSKRLQGARRLLVATALARGGDPRGGATWLRRYGRSQAGFLPAADIELRRASSAAEVEYTHDPTAWLRLFDGVRIAMAAADDYVGTWFRLQRQTWSELEHLHAAELLSVPPDVVFGTLTRMTHNQIGVPPRDDARAALLMSIVLDEESPDRRHGVAS